MAGRKLTCQKPARFVQPFRLNTDLWQTPTDTGPWIVPPVQSIARWKPKIHKSRRLSFKQARVQLPTYADNVKLPVFAAAAAARLAAIDRYFLPAGPTAANLQQRVCCCGSMLETDGQTNGRTDAHCTVTHHHHHIIRLFRSCLTQLTQKVAICVKEINTHLISY